MYATPLLGHSVSFEKRLCFIFSNQVNMFLQTEAPLVIKPYIDILTNSELHSIITSGFATVSGNKK